MEDNMKISLKKLFIDYIPMALAAILMITFAIINEQSFIKTLPTLVSLVVQILSIRANRYAFLIGGTNAMLYCVAAYQEGLYFSILSNILISTPLQYLSFIMWNKKKSAKDARKTQLRVLKPYSRIMIIVATLIAWIPFYFLCRSFFTGDLVVLDSLVFVWGITVALLAAFRYIDSQYLNLFPCAAGIYMWAVICISTPSNLNYLIISFYNLFMVSKASVNWTLQYLNDKKAEEC